MSVTPIEKDRTVPKSSVGQGLISDELVDQLMARVDPEGLALTGEGGLIPELIKAVLERGLQAELADHLGYEKGDPLGRNGLNSRNGTTPKTVVSEAGSVPLDVPRDRQGSFTPRLVPKGQRSLGGLPDMIISLYAGGMTIRDIGHHLESTPGVQLSHETIANITDAVLDEVTSWQTRPLDPVYPVLFLDALVVKCREGNQVRNKSAYIAVGVDCAGIKHVLGIWVASTEGAKFWAGVCAELANRGVRDVIIACCDGLTGFPEAIEATWPETTVQTCTVHLIRNSMRFVAYRDRRAVAAELRKIYTAASLDAAETAMDAFAASELGGKYPTVVNAWISAWDRFIPFLEFAPEVRKVIYTTNAIESLNYQLRKIIKNRGHFPNDQAAVKLLWLAITNIEDKRAHERARAREKGQRVSGTSISGHLIEGTRTGGWPQALQALAIAYPDRIPTNIN